MKKNARFIDLFAGLGGTRIGFEQACESMGIKSKCVFTSEIKEHAIEAYKANFDDDHVHGDITTVEPEKIPNFDYLLAGFPCQPFSYAGTRKGFSDTRGTLFFDIERILKIKSPEGFLLENVQGLESHDKGNTLKVILSNLEKLGYKTTYKVIDSSKHGVPQKRVRTYIVGTKKRSISLDDFEISKSTPRIYLESGKELLDTDFVRKILENFKPDDLHGRKIGDKRGGSNNIHGWDIAIKGTVTDNQNSLLNSLLKQRRRKHWAISKGIDWMDGMPLTLDEILTFIDRPRKEVKSDLESLSKQGYVRFEHPKKLVLTSNELGEYSKREYDETKPKGYNIVTGKLSYPLSRIIDPDVCVQTLVATDAERIAVVDGQGIRKLTIKEAVNLSGFPDWYNLDISRKDAFDLIGNTVMPPIIRIISQRILGKKPPKKKLTKRYIQKELFPSKN